MAERIPQSVGIRVPLQAVLSSDHASPATGKTIAVKISQSGAAYANPSAGSVNATEIGSGSYFVDLSATDTSVLGPLWVIGTASSTDNVIVIYDVVTVQTAAAAAPTPGSAAPTGTNFATPVDIANRALQHCGAEMMDPAQGFTEISKNAQQTSFVYGKLRRAELRMNTWRFATRRAALRAIDSNTLLLAPAMWVSSATYFDGSIVSDATNYLWISRIPNNLGNDPQSTSVWEPYFGPLTVSLYDSTQGYLAGEVVYTAAGDGTNNVYLSRQSNNVVHPALPNQWSTDTTYFQNQVVQVFPAWAVGTTYTKGQGITYTDGNVYASLTNGNVGNTPSTSLTNWALLPVLTLTTPQVPAGPTSLPTSTPIAEWSQLTTYALGNAVMFNGTEYLSLAASNTGNFPNASGSTSWVAVSNGTLYMSLIDLNIGNNPANAPALFNGATTYAINNLVGGSDGLIYKSLANGNTGHDPTTDGGVHWQSTATLNPWTTVFVQGGGNDWWVQIGGASFPNGVALAELNIVYPLGSGPSWQNQTRNVYRLPAGYLKMAAQNPKSGAISYLGVPGNELERDWLFEGNYIVTATVDPIVFRFVADVTDVTQFDDPFCEALAARIGIAVCKPLTQSTAKVGEIAQEYKQWIFDAKRANGIEIGFEDPPLDDWLACRA